MPKSLRSRRHRATIAVLGAKRRAKGWTQRELGDRMKRTQSFIAQVEVGQRQVYVPELFDFAEAFGEDVRVLIDLIDRW